MKFTSKTFSNYCEFLEDRQRIKLLLLPVQPFFVSHDFGTSLNRIQNPVFKSENTFWITGRNFMPSMITKSNLISR